MSEQDRKNKKFPKEDYDKIIKAYQEIKGIELNGPEFSPIQQDIKTMFMAEREPEEIIKFMKWLEQSNEEWTQNWTIRTVKIKMPEWTAGKLKGRKSQTYKY